MAVNIVKEALELSNAIDAEDSLEISINGTMYRYISTSGFSIPELVSKVNGIRKHSPGRALQWLKKNAKGTRIEPITESLDRSTMKTISRFIENNTHSDDIETLNVGDMSREIIKAELGKFINYFTVDDTGVDSEEYYALLDINNEEKCIWYDYYVEQLYSGDDEEVIKIECGEFDLILTITDSFYHALNFSCTKEQLIGAIKSTQEL